MDLFTRTDLKELNSPHTAPCVSLFLPTHRGGSEQDAIRFRKLLAAAQDQLLSAGCRPAQVEEELGPSRRLLEDASFWKNQGDGLALFLAPGFLRVFRVPIVVKELLVAGTRFHVKPLLPLLSGDGRFFVLALSQNHVRLLEGTRYRVSEVDLKGVPRNLAEALLTHDRDEPLSFHTRPSAGGGPWGAIFHGQGVGIDDKKDDLLRYFQKIDRGLHPLLREERAPLVLAGVEYLQPIYRQANTYAGLIDRGIEANPDRWSNEELHERAWPIVRPLFEAEFEKARAHYDQIASSEHASCRLEEVVLAAYEGGVQTLFIPLGVEVWGALDPSRRTIQRRPEPRFEDVDLYDLAAACTLAHGHTVFAVPPGQVPGGKEVAAIFCLPLPKHGKRP